MKRNSKLAELIFSNVFLWGSFVMSRLGNSRGLSIMKKRTLENQKDYCLCRNFKKARTITI